ncbi:hypothetical protein ACFL27_03495 [candidate division CSSED10-310 bacterium]|uniref:HEAT repeat domain-containing protein n=1 Tax=candidate division CSSED10-310 bacterium TaxID=2855610 RepID=A0ABV6YT31_UNCC1
MKLRTWAVLVTLLFFLVFLRFGETYVPVNYDLIDFIKISPLIVKGKITFSDDLTPIILVHEVMKGVSANKLFLEWKTEKHIPGPKLIEGEIYLLFLKKTNNTDVVELVGCGSQGIWPQNWRPNLDKSYILSNATLEEVQKISEKLLLIDAGYQNNLEERENLCFQYIRSTDPLLQLSVMRFLLKRYLWLKSPLDESYQPPINNESKEQFAFLNRFNIFTIPLLKNKNPLIQVEVVNFLRYEHPSISIPLLIKKITDKDSRIRRAVRVVLRTIFTELKIVENLDYRYKDSEEQLKIAQEKWLAWWIENKNKIISTPWIGD